MRKIVVLGDAGEAMDELREMPKLEPAFVGGAAEFLVEGGSPRGFVTS